MIQTYGVSKPSLRLAGFAVLLTVLAGCDESQMPGFLQPKEKAETTGTAPGKSTKLIERDIEAPDVFQVTEAGLWDGRPSLGGVWVAHPDVTDPQRVIIRNSANSKFVIGALFRRERDIPGPRIQASSDAAAALGMLAGAPVELNITALIREEVQEDPVPVEDAAVLEETDDISATPLDPIAGAAAAIEAAPDPNVDADTIAAASATAAPPAPAAATAPAKPKKSSLDKPFIQIGIFSVEANADQAATQMRSAGMLPTVYEQSANGKKFWRVVMGPAQTKSERSALLKKIKATGFSDAYAVSN